MSDSLHSVSSDRPLPARPLIDAVPLPTDPIEVVDVRLGARGPLMIIAGPCAIESQEMLFEVATVMRDACRELGLPYVFKASYDKANRTSVDSYRGPGIDAGLPMLQAVRERIGVPVLTDVHSPGEAERAGHVVDIIQIPAFLCRQTDLLVAAGRTNRAVNIKKGQMVSPESMEHAVRKVRSTGNERVFLTERGAAFGYGNLVVDMRAIPAMQRVTHKPVCFDAGHSVQAPGGLGHATGGDRTMIPTLARAAVAAGADALFIETHPAPDTAKSDGPNQMPLSAMPAFLGQLAALAEAVRAL